MKQNTLIDENKTTLIAALGSQPQLVTCTLDLLLAAGEDIDRVLVVFPGANPRILQSFRLLSEAFRGAGYRGRDIKLQAVPVCAGRRELVEICSPIELEAARKTFFELFRDLKSAGDRIFLSISGGQRIMALLAMNTSMRHFTTEDRIWHIHTSDDLAVDPDEEPGTSAFRKGRVHLIEVPMVPWAVYLPGLAPLLGHTREEVRANGWLEESERARCREVWESITPRQRDALREIAVGRNTKQAADRLGVAPSTVASHRTAVLDVCSGVWLGADVKFDSLFLRERFKPFLVAIGEANSPQTILAAGNVSLRV